MDKVLRAYAKMILDGTAFCNWKNKPSSYVRQRVLECLLERKNDPIYFNLAMESIEKVNTTEELNRLLSEWEIKEEEFKV